MTYDIIVLGDYFFDQIFSGLPRFPRLGCETYCDKLTTTGGAMFITAVSLGRLKARVGWPATFGTDAYSRFVYELTQAEGVDLALARQLDRPFQRVTTAMPFQGDRAFVTYVDAMPSDHHDYWLSVLRQASCRHLHFGGAMPVDELRPLVAAAREQGATVSMDCQDTPLLENPAAVREALPLVDIFIPNARETRIVAQIDDLHAAIESLLSLCPLIVVKDGPNGAWIGHDGDIIRVPGIDAGPAIDTTGAGDCFNAGFLYGHIVERASLEMCARYGNICGGLSVTGIGGATTAPTREELQHWLAKLETQTP
jgi:sugar/nucleoside kinase (ribokinase family)